MEKMENLKLSAPWTTFYREINALFSEDEEIGIIYDEEARTIKLFCKNNDKAEALSLIIPLTKNFGNVEITILVIPPNKNDTLHISNGYVKSDVFFTAFKGNPVFLNATTINEEFVSNPMTFVEFVAKPVQFFNDNITSLYGISTMLYEDIANDIFELNGVFFSTTLLDETKNPVESWIK